MPKNKFQDVVFTAIMATIMVYGMVVYNVALNMGKVTGETFLAAVHELPIMVPVAFVLEFFIVGKIAKALAFTVVTPDDRPQIITYDSSQIVNFSDYSCCFHQCFLQFHILAITNCHFCCIFTLELVCGNPEKLYNRDLTC